MAVIDVRTTSERWNRCVLAVLVPVEPDTITNTIPIPYGTFFCFRSKRVDRCVGVEHEEYLETVDVTSYVGTIPTWLASYFLV